MKGFGFRIEALGSSSCVHSVRGLWLGFRVEGVGFGAQGALTKVM